MTAGEVIAIDTDRFEELEKLIGATFGDRRLLQQAFVHRSFLNENPGFPLSSNERLEFLGDAVLGFISAEYLYFAHSDLPEGQLTRMRAAMVQAETLAKAARSLGLGQYLYLGRGEEASGGRQRLSLLSATFEALVGAVYLDRGLDAARKLVLGILASEQASAGREAIEKDHKSRLQELTQARWQATPVYRTIAAEGPDHEKLFTVEVLVDGVTLGHGFGHSKQEAEQHAAQHALLDWKGEKEEE